MNRPSRRSARAASVLVWVAAGAAALAPPAPDFVERWYAGFLYPALQHWLTAFSNLVPFALLDVLIVCAGVCTIVIIVRGVRGQGSWLGRLARLASRLATVLAAVYLLFLVCWGLNYRRAPAAQRFGVNRADITPVALDALADRTVAAVNATYRDSRPVDLQSMPARLEPALARASARLAAWMPLPGRPKLSLAAYTFPWTGVDGMINPLGLEVVLNPQVLPFERPFVLAHEWAHLAGHAPEDEASFVGWLTCLEGDAAARYSGWLALYLHVVRALPPDRRAQVAVRLDAGPRDDLQAIRRRLARAQPVLQRASWEVYDEYLRANRVSSGIANYDEVVRLVLGAPAAWPHWRTRTKFSKS